jgi:hypothetical protein
LLPNQLPLAKDLQSLEKNFQKEKLLPSKKEEWAHSSRNQNLRHRPPKVIIDLIVIIEIDFMLLIIYTHSFLDNSDEFGEMSSENYLDKESDQDLSLEDSGSDEGGDPGKWTTKEVSLLLDVYHNFKSQFDEPYAVKFRIWNKVKFLTFLLILVLIFVVIRFLKFPK